MKKKPLYLLFATIPAILCLAYILIFGVNLIFQDEWTMIELAQKIHESGLNFADLFAQHNEHRIFFPRLVYLSIAYLSDFNSVAQLLMSFFMLSVYAFAVGSYIAQQKNISENKKCFSIALVSFFIYSLVQFDNLLWGFQIGFIMVAIFPVLSFYFLHLMFHAQSRNKKNIYFILALLTALIASFSSIQGLISWITGVILMLIVFKKKTFTSFYPVVYIIISALTWIIYFINYVQPEHHPDIFYFIKNPVHFLQYFFSMIGDIILLESFGPNVVACGGILIMIFLFIAIGILWKNKERIQQFLFPIALIINGLFTVGSIAVGRCGFLWRPQSRYLSFSIYIIVGLILIWMQLKNQKNKAIVKNLTRILLIALMVSIPMITVKSFYHGELTKTNFEYYAYLMETADIHPDTSLLQLCDNVKSIHETTDFLKKQKYSVFHKPSYKIHPVLYSDSPGQINNDVVLLTQNTLQIFPGYVKITTPEVMPDYYDKIENLYIDINGEIYPLYYKKNESPVFVSWIKNLTHYSPTNNELLITSETIKSGIRYAKIKSVTTAGSYYITDLDMK